jgi:hypothetical protein
MFISNDIAFDSQITDFEQMIAVIVGISKLFRLNDCGYVAVFFFGNGNYGRAQGVVRVEIALSLRSAQ